MCRMAGLSVSVHTLRRHVVLSILMVAVGLLTVQGAPGEVELATVDSSAEVDVSSSEDDGGATAASEPPPTRILKPTSEWQTVEPGMGIPPGLHVRMNFETHKTEAKLLEPEDGIQSASSSSQATAAADQDQDQEQSVTNIELPRDMRQGIVNTKKMVFTPDQLANHLKEQNKPVAPGAERPAISYDEDAVHDGDGKPSLDDLARGFANARKKVKDMKPRADVEVMQFLVALLKNESTPDDKKLIALEELENFVHQIDNAGDLEAIGGMEVVVATLDSSDAEFRSTAALILGSAMQGNPTVQKIVLRYDVLPKLVDFLKSSSQQTKTVRRRSIFAVSALVRSFPEAQRALWELNGLSMLKNLCRSSSPDHVPVLCVKAVTLIYDILVQETAGELGDRQPKLLPHLAASGWCDTVVDLLSSQDGDVLEKAVAALGVLVPACGNHLAQHTTALQQVAALEHHWRAQSAEKDDEDDQYFAGMHDLARRVHTELNACAVHSNCTLPSPSLAQDSSSHRDSEHSQQASHTEL